ncbi:MAG: hypothetical protein U0234_03435 [Sandaracinus sp.]
MRRLGTLLVSTLLGCTAEASLPEPFGGDTLALSVELPPDTSEVDVLLVVDGSPSMDAFHDSARALMVESVRALASGTLPDATGRFTPSHFLRVAVIDSDVGAPGAPGCSALGDGGRFLGDHACPFADELRAADGVLAFRAGRDDADQLADAVACVLASVHTRCPYSRPLDAIERALGARATDLIHEGARVLVLIATAQDDCSTEDETIFSSAPPFGLVATGLRCHVLSERLRAPATLLDTLGVPPTSLYLGIAAGLPFTSLGLGPAEVLPMLDAHVDPTHPDRLAPACEHDAAGAAPGVRLAELAASAAERGATTVLAPICDLPDGGLRAYEQPLPEPPTPSLCLPRLLAVDDRSGLVDCRYEIALPPLGSSVSPEHCESLTSDGGLTLDRVEPAIDPFDGRVTAREICAVRQLRSDEVSLSGWRYEVPGRWGACPQAASLEQVPAIAGARLDLRCDLD